MARKWPWILTAAFQALCLAIGLAAESPLSSPQPDDQMRIEGDGYLVWETNRTGAWRIWTCRLDGSGLQQLAHDVRGRQHCCPHISPDGVRIAYASFPEMADTYRDGLAVGELHLIKPDGSDDKIIVPRVRTYGENRAVVWKSSSELIYISGDGYTMLLNLVDGTSSRLTREPYAKNGYLINSTLTCATTGTPVFAPFDKKKGMIGDPGKCGGCQPYFSNDGVWGFWTAGAGGPLNAIDLESKEITTIVEKNDPRLPAGLGYLYFPMLSRDGHLFAFAASPDQHDHFTSDYEIFVAEIDPKTLQIIDRPVRYTHHPATDRYPDVFLEPLGLGDEQVEASGSVTFKASTLRGVWEWDYGDGTKGALPSHKYSAAGVYHVRATQGTVVVTGRVAVSKASSPAVAAVALHGKRQVDVVFNEPVQFQDLKLTLDSHRAIATWATGSDHRALQITLADDLTANDWLNIDGVLDLAQQPNRMPPARLALSPPSWPSKMDGLLFLWKDAGSLNRVSDHESERLCSVTAEGRAWIDRNGSMTLRGGSFRAADRDSAAVVSGCRRTNNISIEATIMPGEPMTDGAIIALSGGTRFRNFTVEQKGGDLVFRLGRERAFIKWPQGKDSLDLALTYTPGRLTYYIDGLLAGDSRDILGDFFHWKPQRLEFGREHGSDRLWMGTIDGVAIFDRVMSAEEIQENCGRYKDAISKRVPAPKMEIDAILQHSSNVPSLDRINPYRDALAVDEYQVQRVLTGDYAPSVIRVVRWAIINGEVLPPPGGIRRLFLEKFSAQSQLQSIYLSDTLNENFALDLYFDLGWPPANTSAGR